MEEKVEISIARIMEWYIRHDKKCYVSFSGGKDSTVLADLAAKVCSLFKCKLILWFSDTGLEYPELREHVKQFSNYLKEKYNDTEVELIIEYPRDPKTGKRITYKDVILEKGYPIISKEVSQVIEEARGYDPETGKYLYRIKRLNGELLDKSGKKSPYNCEKWKFLLDAPFKISNKCCNEMKKKPSKYFEKKSGLAPIIGTMTDESKLRKQQWLRNGCNAYDTTRPISKPLSFWSEQDILKYIVENKLPIASVYGDIKSNEDGKFYTTKCQRTGCMYCAYGCQLEKEPNRFQKLKETHPKIWEYCMKPVEDGGLGMREVLNFINVKVE